MYQLDASAIQALLAQATEAAGGSARGGPQEDNKDDGGSDFKVSEGEKHRMRKMCGLDYTAGDECLPKWYKDLFAKHQDEKDKAQVIATAIVKCHIFDDAEVPLYPTLVKTTVKKDWTASDIRKRATLVNVVMGLSPFTMLDMTEEVVALMQQDHEDLLNASLISTSEVKSTRAKLIATTPSDSEGFMMMLKRFANLLFALFSSS